MQSKRRSAWPQSSRSAAPESHRVQMLTSPRPFLGAPLSYFLVSLTSFFPHGTVILTSPTSEVGDLKEVPFSLPVSNKAGRKARGGRGGAPSTPYSRQPHLEKVPASRRSLEPSEEEGPTRRLRLAPPLLL